MNLDHLTTALIILLASLPVSLPAAVLVLRWGFRTPGRPPGYRPRHRRPWWPWRRHKAAAHEGATADWSPTAEVEAVPVVEPSESERLNAAEWGEYAAHWNRIDRELDAELAALFAKVEDQTIAARIACGRTEAALLRSAGVTPRRATWDEETGSFNRRELRALLEADELVPV